MARRAHLRDCNPSLSSETFRESQTYHDQRSVHVEHHVHNPDPAMVQQQQCSSKGQVEAVHAVSQAHVVAETSRAEPSDPKGAVGSFLKIESTAESGRIFGKGWGQKPRCFEWYNRAHGYRWQAAQVEQGHEVAGSTYLEALDDGIGHKDVLSSELSHAVASAVQIQKPKPKSTEGRWFVEFCCVEREFSCCMIAE